MSKLRKRIQVYTDGETKRRIELAAAKHGVSVTQYCLEAIKQQLAEDELLERERVEITICPVQETDLVADLRTLQAKIKARRGGKLIDLDRVLDETREEREYELSGLR